MSLSFQTAVLKNEAKLSSFVQFENEVKSSLFTITLQLKCLTLHGNKIRKI